MPNKTAMTVVGVTISCAQIDAALKNLTNTFSVSQLEEQLTANGVPSHLAPRCAGRVLLRLKFFERVHSIKADTYQFLPDKHNLPYTP